jgi:hypothetical protein
LQPIYKHTTNQRIPSESQRQINGALIFFGAGAGVVKVQLKSDFSSIKITNLGALITASDVRTLLLDFGVRVDKSWITLQPSRGSALTAKARAESPSFARVVVERWEQRAKSYSITIKDDTFAAENAALEKQVKLSAVTCTWYQSSRLAWLVYPDEEVATRAISIIKQAKILGRTPDAVIREVSHIDGKLVSCTVGVSNLHGQTTLKDIRDKLFGCVSPDKIHLSDPSYKYSNAGIAFFIRRLLERFGRLESFRYDLVSGTKVKAFASFLKQEAAAEAVRTLHNRNFNSLGNTRIFVNHVISVKYHVSTPIITALKAELVTMGEDFFQSSKIQLRIYQQEDSSKSYTVVRLLWENLQNVTGAKIRLERLLAGVLIKQSAEPLWDIYFTTPAALDDLAELGAVHNLYIFRDLRKSKLLIYGGTLESRDEVRRALINRIEEMHSFEHTLVLTPHLLRLAVQGGTERLKAKFGNAVKFNFQLHRSTITITGPREYFVQAQALLCEQSSDSRSSTSPQTTTNCVICWSETDQPVRTACHHMYCKECLTNQASSATEADIPLRCFGAEGTCQQLFGFDELNKLLPPKAFESLLLASFDYHVRTRPDYYQYCPTPDCPQVYHPSSDGHIFYCSSCLTPICTTCNVISHEGLSCKEWQEMGTEAGRLFRQYKEEHDIRDCPNCKASIEKNEGCNHMECRQCGIHICWFCMDTFEHSSRCYDHMRNRHGNIFGDD